MSKLTVRIEPWQARDLPLLQRLLGDATMMRFLGGPEPLAKISERHTRYVTDPRQSRIVVGDEAVGWVGYWDHAWRAQTIYEIGWFVLPEWQGRGVASRATRAAVSQARERRDHRYMHAFPAVDNGPSNGICRSAGFELLGPLDFEYPSGSGRHVRCNDWRLDLQADAMEGS